MAKSPDDFADPWPAPRAAERPIGHDAAAREFLRLLNAGRLPHAWLICGPKGIGKATLAFHLAARALSGRPTPEAGLFDAGGQGPAFLPPTDPVARRVASGGHPDLLTIERGVSDTTGKLRRDITVDEVRRLGRFLRLTAAEGGARAVVVDSADDLNRNAANALLKLLEEPPGNALIFLISHAPRSILPTIRSRCRTLALGPLTADDTAAVVERVLPNADPADRNLAAGISVGRPGIAVRLVEDGGLEVVRDLYDHLQGLPDLDFERIEQIGDGIARERDPRALDRFVFGIEWWLRRLIRRAVTGMAEAEVFEGEGAVLGRLGARGLDPWLEVWEKIGRLHRRTVAANLDPKQAVISAFNLLHAAARA